MFPQFFKFFARFLKVDLALPIVLILVYIFFLVILRGYIPTSEELVQTFASLYQKYGYEIIFVASFLEALILINLFVPGQMAMALGVVFARSGQTELIPVIIVASLGALAGYILDYSIGFFGFADIIKKLGYQDILNQANLQIKKFGDRSLILGFAQSNLGALISLSAGTISIKPRTFLLIAVIATFFWMSLWGILIYIIGDIVLHIFSKYAFLIIFLILLGFLLIRLWKKDSTKKK